MWKDEDAEEGVVAAGVVSLFGPEDSVTPKQKNNKEKKNRAQKQHRQKNKTNKKEIRARQKDKDTMDTFLGLFDPALEDETTDDIDELNGNVVEKNHENTKYKNCKNSYSLRSETLGGVRRGPRVAIMPDQLPSEPQEGNIEYKLKLVNPNHERFKRLVSQMQWRLREGLGEAIYEIGVEDSGILLGLTQEELGASMATLRRMAKQLGASLTVIREKTISGHNGEIRKAAEVLVRKVPDDQYSIELRIAVLGNSDVGKSTLLGVLTRGELDNGRGCARLNVFRHRHEVCSGKTSSISLQIMGFDSQGNVIDQTCTRSRDYDDEDICSQSIKIINFIDLAGDQKYLKTTVFGLSGYSPHYAVLVVSAFSGMAPMTEEHLSLARALDVPIVIVITKTDMATPQQIQRTINDLKQTLTQPGYKRVPLLIQNEDDAITAGSNQLDNNVVPIFCASSVTGDGLTLLKKFLFVLPPRMSNKEREKLEQEPAEFQIDEVFHVDHSVIVGGLLTKGVIMQGTTLLLGPMDNCTFVPVTVGSIHRNKVPCRVVCAGQSASLSIKGQDLSLRKGMKLMSIEARPRGCFYFQARTQVLHHSTSICRGFQATVHIGNVQQTAVVEGILGSRGLHTNDRGSVIFRFLRQPEVVQNGARLLFRQGMTKGIGQVIQVFEEEPDNVNLYNGYER
ncbi:GTP-binding protein 2-like isoform X1 [Penaeus chinensis]|uniref:GTP-binding protein 2-like isoform X1 n=2 Tax=Penaeus chinensis TaxID=139456 RepID=UPI001FB62761|nr:GTP-binding protein 2-like isoform X1 [Penaeus chinensis]XP_047495622.1 GTP-binding protein 2-like isoform X1 [Penaeus chinensis]